MEKYSFARYALFAALSLSASQVTAGGNMAAPVESYDWTGFYLGAQVGYGHDKIDWDLFDGISTTESFHQSRNTGKYGAQAGYQFQSDRWVFGLEGSYIRNFSNKSMLSMSTLAPNRSRESRVNNLWLVTPRLGLANGRWLPYIKGGYANAKVNFDTFLTDTGVRTSHSAKNNNGWTIGAGVDYALADNLIFGLEYDYVRLNVKDRLQTADPGFAVGTVSNANANSNLFMARLSYKI